MGVCCGLCSIAHSNKYSCGYHWWFCSLHLWNSIRYNTIVPTVPLFPLRCAGEGEEFLLKWGPRSKVHIGLSAVQWHGRSSIQPAVYHGHVMSCYMIVLGVQLHFGRLSPIYRLTAFCQKLGCLNPTTVLPYVSENRIVSGFLSNMIRWIRNMRILGPQLYPNMIHPIWGYNIISHH